MSTYAPPNEKSGSSPEVRLGDSPVLTLSFKGLSVVNAKEAVSGVAPGSALTCSSSPSDPYTGNASTYARSEGSDGVIKPRAYQIETIGAHAYAAESRHLERLILLVRTRLLLHLVDDSSESFESLQSV